MKSGDKPSETKCIQAFVTQGLHGLNRVKFLQWYFEYKKQAEPAPMPGAQIKIHFILRT